MELDATVTRDFSSSMVDDINVDPSAKGSISSMINDVTSSFPGIDEAMSFAELMKQVQTMDYSVIVFDTAPTGHTLRLIGFPGMLEGVMSKMSEMKDKFSGIISSVLIIIIYCIYSLECQEEVVVVLLIQCLEKYFYYLFIYEQINDLKDLSDRVNKQFKNSDYTTFICVCIPEFLSVYETERLVQELSRNEMDSHNIIVNQVLFVEKGSTCVKCNSRRKMQEKYLDQIDELYDSLHVVLLPQMNEEVRGAESIISFSENLIKPYKE